MGNLRYYLLLLFLAATLLGGCSSSSTPSPTESVSVPDVEMTEVTVYFFSEERFAVGTEPYEVGVLRQIHPDANLPYLALEAYFEGPTELEAAQGLSAILSGCTGFSSFTIESGIARVFLEGPCASGGSTYTIAGPVMKTLLQFDEIDYVKLYDASGATGEPSGPSNSIPFVLEP